MIAAPSPAKTDPVDYPMTEAERILYGEWFLLIAEVGKAKPGAREMADLCEALARHTASSARGCRVAYGQSFSRDKAREVVVLEAVARLIDRLDFHMSKLSKELKMALGG